MKNKLNQLKEQILNLWQSLKPRERFLLTVTFLLFSILFFVQYGIVSPLKKIKETKKSINKIHDDLDKINNLYPIYCRLKAIKTDSSSTQSDGESGLLVLIEKISMDNNIKTNIRYMRPSSLPIKGQEGKMVKRSAELKIESLPINQVFKFLYDIEFHPAGLAVEYILLRETYNKTSFFDLTVRIAKMEKA